MDQVLLSTRRWTGNSVSGGTKVVVNTKSLRRCRGGAGIDGGVPGRKWKLPTKNLYRGSQGGWIIHSSRKAKCSKWDRMHLGKKEKKDRGPGGGALEVRLLGGDHLGEGKSGNRKEIQIVEQNIGYEEEEHFGKRFQI